MEISSSSGRPMNQTRRRLSNHAQSLTRVMTLLATLSCSSQDGSTVTPAAPCTAPLVEPSNSIRVLVSPPIDSEDRSDSLVTLKWNASSDTLGYRLYIGSSSKSYQQVADVGLLTTAMVSNLSGDRTYYFVVTAYNSVGESCASNEVSARIQ